MPRRERVEADSILPAFTSQQLLRQPRYANLFPAAANVAVNERRQSNDCSVLLLGRCI